LQLRRRSPPPCKSPRRTRRRWPRSRSSCRPAQRCRRRKGWPWPRKCP
jgi:hypothetical protein